MATHSRILALDNPIGRGAWHATVHRVAELDTAEATQHACSQPDTYLTLS